jgi:hypothetical protein
MHVRHCLLVAAAALGAGCATVAPPPASTTPTPAPAGPAAPLPTAPKPYVEPPPPPVNLQGFPPTYRLGFGDGCDSGRGNDKRDPVRYANDGNYRTGWVDGHAQCKKK